MRTLILMCGCPGSGKSTIAEEIGDKYMIPIVASDKVRKQLYGDETVQGDFEEIFDEVYRQVNYLIECGACILDATHCTRFARTRAIARVCPDQTIVIKTNANLNKAIKQNAARERVVPESIIRHMVKNLRKEPPSEREGRNVRVFRYDDPALFDLLETI